MMINLSMISYACMRTFGLAFGFALVAGCAAQRPVDTLDTLTTSAGFDGVALKPINLGHPSQTRFLVSNGLLPVSAPGEACIASSFRPASSVMCFSPSRETQIAVRRFDFKGGIGALHAMREALQDLQVDIVKLARDDIQAQTQVEGDDATITAEQKKALSASADEIVKQANTIADALKKENFFIFRNAGQDNADVNGGVTGLFTGQAAARRTQSGSVIVGGLTFSYMLLGNSEDLTTRYGHLPSTSKVATYTLGAKHLVYFSTLDLSAALGAELTGSRADIDALSPATKAAIKAYVGIGRAFEAQGAFSAAKLERLSPTAYAEKYGTQHVFYSTMTDVETLLDAVQN